MVELRKRKTVLTVLILGTLMVALIPMFVYRTQVNTVNALGGTKLVILPATNKFYTNVTKPGSKFWINATVQNVTDLQNWQIMLAWDPNLLNFSQIRLPNDHVFAPIDNSIYPGTPGARSMIQPPPISNPGSVSWGCTYIIAPPSLPYWTFNGTGTLCQIELEILAPPNPRSATCNLTFANPGVDTFLIDGEFMDISFTRTPGSFEYKDTLSVKINPSGTTQVDVGGNVTFTANATGGVEPYTYKWFIDTNVVPGATSSSWTFKVNASGRYTIKVFAIDAIEYNASATATVLTRILSTTLSPSAAAIDLGGSKTFTATASGGKSPYKYQWYVKYPNATEREITNAINRTVWSIIFNVTGVYNVKVKVTDAELTVRNATSTVTVFPTPTTTVKVIPEKATFYTNETVVGDVIILNVTVQNVTNLENWQMNITWNPTLLNYSAFLLPADNVFAGAVAAGKRLQTAGPVVAPGSVVFGCEIINTLPYWTFNGTGTLCQIKLETTRQPYSPNSSCTIGLANKYTDTFILELGPKDIPFYAKNATYTYVLVEHVTHEIWNYTIETYSNTSIKTNTVFGNIEEKKINFTAYGAPGTSAFVNVTIPTTMLNAISFEEWKVYLDGVNKTTEAIITGNADYTYVYLEFVFSSPVTVTVKGTWMVPELASMLLIILMIASFVAVLLAKASVKKKW